MVIGDVLETHAIPALSARRAGSVQAREELAGVPFGGLGVV